MQKFNQKTFTRKLRPFMAVFILFVMSGFTVPGLAQEPQWEIMLPNVHGKIAVDPTDSDVIYIAVRGPWSGHTDYKSGMLKSTDGGNTWDFYREGWGMGSPEHILINPDNPDEIRVSGGPSVGVVLSTDGGKTWERADYGIHTDSHGYSVKQLAYDRKNGIYYMADWIGGNYNGLRRSEDGKTWQSIKDAPVGDYLSVLVDELHDNIFAGISSSFISLTRGSMEIDQDWENVSDIIPPVWHLAKVPGSRTLYAGTSFGIFKSYDGAESWVSVNDSLTEQLRFGGGLAVSQIDTNTVFAAGRASSRLEYSSGIFISRNGGNSWTRMDFDIPDSIRANTHHLFFDNQSNTLYANIELTNEPNELNVYRLRDALATDASDYRDLEIEVPDQIELYQNYPNPFNPVTVIEYDISEPVEVTLRVYDVMGRLVETLVDQMVSPGKHQSTWDASNAASGVYIYRIQVGDFIQSRQMLLIK